MPARKRYALILAAGFGSRMGPLGKELPKPLWPIFETTILGHIINQLQVIGFEKIFVNAHHRKEQVQAYINENYPEVEVLFEDPILDSAGCLVNCAQKINDSQGELFTFNGDNLIDLRALDLRELNAEIALYSEEVEANSTYNRLRVENERLCEIMRPGHPQYATSNVTYAGISRIKLSCKKLAQEIRPIGIFKGFIDFENDHVAVLPFSAKQIDLGTFDLYQNNLRRLINELGRDGSLWKEFLHQFCGFDESRAWHAMKSYNATCATEVLNFSGVTYRGEVAQTLIFSEVSPEDEAALVPGEIYWKGKSYGRS